MKDKILVIKPPHPMFPLGMAYALASLESHGIEFDFVDAQFGDHYKKLLRKNDYCAIATGGLISQHSFFSEVSRYSRENKPDVPLILGGGIATDMQPDFLFDKLKFTYGIRGEAETSFPFLVDILMGKATGFETISGLLHKDKQTGEIKKNPIRRLDLSAADPLPAWHRFNVDYYLNNWDHGIFGHRLCMPMVSARGCTGACTFCSSFGGAFRKRPIDHVVNEIAFLEEKYVFDWISFNSEMFYSAKEDIVNFCEEFKSAGFRKKWICDLRVDVDYDIDMFRLMKSAGCVAVFGGLESGSNKILSLMQKRTTKEMITRFFRTAESACLPCIGGFLAGNEGESRIELQETVDMVTNEKMRAVDQLICTYPGTKIYKNAMKRGLINDEWDYLDRLNFLADFWDFSVSKKDYLNISDIPNDRFWEIIVGEFRRFHTFNLTHFVPKNMTCSPKFGIMIKVAGNCAECGCHISLVVPRKMLGIQTNCPNCFRTIEFNLYTTPDFSDHCRYLCDELAKMNRLAIVGAKSEATNLLKYDYFDLDFHSLAAVVEVDKKESGIPDFCHLPRMGMEDLPKLNPDGILIADDLFGDVELKIRKFYLKKSLNPPGIFHLFPDNKRPFVRILRFARNHSAPTAWNKRLVIMVIEIPVIIAKAKARFVAIAKSNYKKLNKNALVRIFLR